MSLDGLRKTTKNPRCSNWSQFNARNLVVDYFTASFLVHSMERL